MKILFKMLTIGLVRAHSFYLPPSYFGTILPIIATAIIMYGLLPALIGGAIYIVSTVIFFALIIHLFSFFLIDLYMAAALSVIVFTTLLIIWLSTSFRINYEAGFKRMRLHYISRSAIMFLMTWLTNKHFDMELSHKTKFLEIRLKKYDEILTDLPSKQQMARELYADIVRLTEFFGNDIILYGFSAGSFEKLLVEAGLGESQIKVYKTIIPPHHSLIYSDHERFFHIHLIDVRGMGLTDAIIKDSHETPF